MPSAFDFDFLASLSSPNSFFSFFFLVAGDYAEEVEDEEKKHGTVADSVGESVISREDERREGNNSVGDGEGLDLGEARRMRLAKLGTDSNKWFFLILIIINI